MKNTERSGAGRAVITGASSGIGEAFAYQLAALGLDLLLVARRLDRLQALAELLERAHGIRVQVIQVDLSDAASTSTIMEAVGAGRGPLKFLVNNAGYGFADRFDAVPWDQHKSFLRVMAEVPVELTYALLPLLKASAPAHVINVASLAAYLPGAPYNGLYAGAKSLLVKFSETLAAELERDDVTVTASCPGMTTSEILDHAGGKLNMDKIQRFRFMAASEVAREAIGAAKRGQVSVIHGWDNRLIARLMTFLPEAIARKIVDIQGSTIFAG